MTLYFRFRGDSQIEEDDRTYVRVQETAERSFLVVLELNDVVESDAGLYKVKAKNKFGEVSASINLNFSRKCPTLKNRNSRRTQNMGCFQIYNEKLTGRYQTFYHFILFQPSTLRQCRELTKSKFGEHYCVILQRILLMHEHAILRKSIFW